MFEDSTFESNGKIHTRSRAWAVAALVLNGTILAVIVLLPLLYPQALQREEISTVVFAPQPPAQVSEAPKALAARANAPDSNFMETQLIVPRKLPQNLEMSRDREPDSFECAECVPGGTVSSLSSGSGLSNPFKHNAPLVVTQHSVRASSGVAEGLIIQKTPPIYPPIARETRTQGTVVLAATISKTGAIESLHVISGSPMLQQAALNAVKTWRYRPYLLNGEPVEVETSVNVVFKLGDQ